MARSLISLEFSGISWRELEHTNHSNMTSLEATVQFDALGSLIEEAILTRDFRLARTLCRVRVLHARHDEKVVG
jgi:hypothetical protein